MKYLKLGIGILSLLFVRCGDVVANTEVADTWSVSPNFQGKTAKNGKVEDAEDVSGMACAPAESGKRLCLLVDDETQGAQIVILSGNHIVSGNYIPLITDKFGEKSLELDGEAVAFADGTFYVIGSHGRPRNEEEADEEKNVARARASSHLFSIRFKAGSVDLVTGKTNANPEISEAVALDKFFETGSKLQQQFGQPLESNGMTVEGLAILGNDAVIGFRGPVDGEAALLLKVPLSDLFGGAVKESRGEVTKLCLGRDGRGNPRGFRDLVAVGSTIFGIAGPVNDPAKGAPATADYAILRLTAEGDAELRRLEDKDAKVKPEALVLLEADDASFTGLLLFDGPANGAPKSLKIDFDKPAKDGESASASCTPTVSAAPKGS